MELEIIPVLHYNFMMDEPDNLVLRLLKEIRNDVSDLKERYLEISERMSHIEAGVAGLNGRMDRIERDVHQIKKRLELVSA